MSKEKEEKVEKEYFTVREVARKLNLTPITVRSMIKGGVISAIRFGPRTLRIDKKALLDYISELEDKNPYE